MVDFKKPLPAASLFGRVAVVMGGWSSEREVSLMGGATVLKALKMYGINAEGIDAKLDIVDQLRQGGFDRVFLMLHGEGGEDGRIQGALDMAKLPYTGTGVLGSALCMDKMRMKWMCQTLDIPTPRWRPISHEDHAVEALSSLGGKIVIKPSREGSSVGVSIVDSPRAAKEAYHLAARYGQVICEQFITGKEVTVSVVDTELLPIVSMQPKREFYDYKAKYEDAGTVYEVPAKLNSQSETAINHLARLAFDAFACYGWGRADFMLDEKGAPWFIEMNTVPGMTEHSLVPMAAKAAGISLDQLVVRILATTLR